MPLQKLQFRPGLNREGTDYSNEGGWYDGDKIRFRSGFPEKIGGWTQYSSSTVLGNVRDIWAWVDLSNNSYLGVGTSAKYYIENGGTYNDVTPYVPNVNSVFTAPAGAYTETLATITPTAGSATLSVTKGSYTPSVGDFVVLTGPSTTLSATIASGTAAPFTVQTASTSGFATSGTILIDNEQFTYTSLSTVPVGFNVTARAVNGTTAANHNTTGVPVTNPTVGGTSGVGGLTINGEYLITAVAAGSFSITSTSSATTASTSTAVTATFFAGFEYPQGAASYSISSGWGTGPWQSPGTSALGNNPFATVVGTPTVTVTQTAHGLTAGSYVSFSGATAVGGLTLNATYTVTTVLTANTYTITAASNATSTATGGGASVLVGTRGWGAAYNSGTAAAATSQLRLWTSDNFGQDLVIAPRGGPIYYWEDSNGTSTRAQPLAYLATSAGYSGQYVPNGTNQVIASSIQQFIIALGANSYVSGTPGTAFNPMLVRWSDQRNAYQWVPAVTNQSGEFPLTNGSYIVGGTTTRQEILIWTDSALYSMQYIGAPYVWGFQILMDNISVMSPNAMVTVNNVTYWMGQDKFYMYSGRVETLPCALRQYIFDDINKDQSFQVFAGSNEGYNEVWWYYCSGSSSTVDKYVIYNYLDRVWYYGSLARTSWLDTGIKQYPIGAGYATPTFTGSISGTTLTVASGSVTGKILPLTFLVGTNVATNTLITRQLTGTTGGAGTYQVSVSQTLSSSSLTTSGTSILLNHESGNDDVSTGTPAAIYSYVQSSDFDIGDGHNFGFVWRILPDVNFNGSNINAPSVTMTVLPRQNSGTAYGTADNPTVTSSNNYSSRSVYTVQEFTGQVYTRLRGRQLSFKLESTALGVAWQLGTPRIDIRPDGRR